jgi:hypothetical protein
MVEHVFKKCEVFNLNTKNRGAGDWRGEEGWKEGKRKGGEKERGEEEGRKEEKRKKEGRKERRRISLVIHWYSNK